jgi:anaerobic magnesium-protoporphyrin IX monomethyl ester cyclase
VDYEEIVRFQPFLIGMSVFDDSKESVYRICAKIKQLMPEVYICVGAALPTYIAGERLQECPHSDFVVRGEGEETTWELICQLQAGHSLEDNHKIIGFLRQYQIFVDAGFINFNPYSSLEHLRINGDFLQRYGFANNIKQLLNRYKMFRGVKLFEKIKKDALLKEGKFTEYGYYFVDQRIEWLANFMDAYKKQLDRDIDSITERHSYYANEYSLLLQHFVLWFKATNHIEAHELARNTKEQVDKILSRHNTIFSQWFAKLICLAENGWSDEETWHISRDTVKPEVLRECVDQISELHLGFYKKMYDLGLETDLVEIA